MLDTQNAEAVAVAEPHKTMAALAHALVLTGYVVPLANILAPLVIYLTKKDESVFVGEHARESLNFQINQTVWALVFGVLSLVGVGCVLLLGQAVFELVYVIRASIAAKDGLPFRYPLTIRLV